MTRQDSLAWRFAEMYDRVSDLAFGVLPKRDFVETGPSHRRTDNRFRAVAHVVLFFFAMNPSVLLMGERGAGSGNNGLGAETSPLFYLFAIACYGLAAIGILLRLNFSLLPLLRAAPIWLIVGYAFASVLWSIDPNHSLSRATGFLGTTLAAALIATFPRAAQLRILAVTFGVVLLASLLFVAIMPDLAVSTYRGETTARGIYVHKNIYGWAASLFTLTILGAWRARAIGTIRAVPFIAAGVLGVWLSQSASSICALVVGSVVMMVLSLLRRAGKARSFLSGMAISAIAGIGTLSGLLLPWILKLFDKTPTLSGRTRLWSALEPAMAERFIGGWGFGGALWQSHRGQDFLEYEFFAGNAQGGYVENQINLGLIGSTFFYGAVMWVIIGLFRRSNFGDLYARTMLVVLVAMLLLGIVAPIFMPANQAFWILLAIPMFDCFGPLRAPRVPKPAREATPLACYFAPLHRLAPRSPSARA
jgi:exopolysaccharide production protein ExoQ